MTQTCERVRISSQVAMVLAGNRVDDAIKALCDNLITVIASASDNPSQAVYLLESLTPGIANTFRNNWDVILQAKAKVRANASVSRGTYNA